MEKDIELKQIANDFQKSFEDILDRVVDIAKSSKQRTVYANINEQELFWNNIMMDMRNLLGTFRSQ